MGCFCERCECVQAAHNDHIMRKRAGASGGYEILGGRRGGKGSGVDVERGAEERPGDAVRLEMHGHAVLE